MSRRKNAGEGYGFMFHGAFADKEDAVKKEKKTPGSFIKGRSTAHGWRWIVMSPRKNPIRRKRRANGELSKAEVKRLQKQAEITGMVANAVSAYHSWRRMGFTHKGAIREAMKAYRGASRGAVLRGLKAEIAGRENPNPKKISETIARRAGLRATKLMQAAQAAFGTPRYSVLEARARKALALSDDLWREFYQQKRSNPGELLVLGANPMPGDREISIPAGSTITIRTNPLQVNPICGNPVGGGLKCSRKPGHKGPHLPQGATLRPRSRVPSAWVGRRQNPSAAAIREEFTGKPSEKFFVQDVAGMPAGDYAQLGELLALYVKPVGGGQRQTIDFRQGERPLLVCDETRRQLYFIGGDQDVSGALPAFGIHHATGTEEILLGSARRIDYKQRKEHADQPELDEWRHDLGEETHVFPDLYFDPVEKRLLLRGGEYEVRREGIVN